MRINITQEPKKSVGDREVIDIDPQAFNSVKDWQNIEVTGIPYYVNKAESLGAIKVATPKRTKK